MLGGSSLTEGNSLEKKTAMGCQLTLRTAEVWVHLPDKGCLGRTTIVSPGRCQLYFMLVFPNRPLLPLLWLTADIAQEMYLPKKRRGKTSVEKAGKVEKARHFWEESVPLICGSGLGIKLLFMVPDVKSQQPQLVTLLSY